MDAPLDFEGPLHRFGDGVGCFVHHLVGIPGRVALFGDGLHAPPLAALGLPGLLGIAAVVGAASAVANNLPVSVSAAAVLAGPYAYGATIGLAIGSLATAHGSVATLIAAELAGPSAPAFPTRRFAALAGAALVAATLLLWALP